MNKINDYRLVVCLALLIMGSTLSVLGAEEKYVPVYNPTMDISRLVGEIKIDGSLDDSGWRQAAVADNFAEHQPGDQVQPPVDTKVFMTYDEDHIYVAFIAYDDPAKLRASLCNRERIGGDDNVGFFFDTYGDATWAYTMNCNPYGIQSDALWSSGYGEDGSYDLIWESSGQVTDSGYQVEMAIPFSSLRFPNKDVQTWKVDFWRNHPRENNRQYSWAAYDRDETCWPCQWGTVNGIKGVKPGRGVEILPSLITYQSGKREGDKFLNDDADGEMSIEGKYAVTSDITAEITYNPDFSQIEADATQIDVNSTTALSYAEKRPFFQEGSDLFRTTFNTVYTRSINDPQVAAKVTGRLGRSSFAYMGARDEHTPIIMPLELRSAFVAAGKSMTNIFRFKQTVADNSHVGLLVTDRRLDDGGNNTLLGVDAHLRLSKSYSIVWQALGTHTEEPDDTMMTAGYPAYYGQYFDDSAHTVHYDGETYWGNAAYFGISREDSHLNIDLAYLQKSPTFRADNGYQPTNNRRKAQLYAGYMFYFDKGIVERFYPNFTIAREWNYNGDLNEEYIWLESEICLNVAATNIHPRYTKYTQRYGGIEFDNIWTLHNCFSSTFTDWLSAGGAISYAHQIAYSDTAMSKETYLSAWLDLKPTEKLFIENWFNHAHCKALDGGREIYSGYTARTRWSYQFNRELSLRLVAEYNDFGKVWSLDPLVTYQINPFSVLYAGSSYGYSEYNIVTDDQHDPPIVDPQWKLGSRQFFLKLKYLFQI